MLFRCENDDRCLLCVIYGRMTLIRVEGCPGLRDPMGSKKIGNSSGDLVNTREPQITTGRAHLSWYCTYTPMCGSKEELIDCKGRVGVGDVAWRMSCNCRIVKRNSSRTRKTSLQKHQTSLPSTIQSPWSAVKHQGGPLR